MGLVDQHLVRDGAVRVDRAEAELRADLRHRHAVLRVLPAARPALEVAAFGLHLVVPLVVRAHEPLLAAEHVVLRVDELRGLRAQLRETRLTAHGTRAQVEVAPARVVAHDLGSHERAELGEELLARVALRHARKRLRHHLALDLAVLPGGEDLRDVKPGVLVDPVALQPFARERHAVRVRRRRVRRKCVERHHLRDLAVVPLAVAGDRIAVHPRPLPHHAVEPAVADRLAVRVVHLYLQIAGIRLRPRDVGRVGVDDGRQRDALRERHETRRPLPVGARPHAHVRRHRRRPAVARDKLQTRHLARRAEVEHERARHGRGGERRIGLRVLPVARVILEAGIRREVAVNHLVSGVSRAVGLAGGRHRHRTELRGQCGRRGYQNRNKSKLFRFHGFNFH